MSGDHNMYASGSGNGQRSGWRKRTIMEMAREAGMPFYWRTGEITYLDKLERFAELVREDERNACAKVCADWPNGRDDVSLISIAIRARGDKHD
jgi:hypothetical protein